MNILAIIPARGGSKGIPGKNIQPLAGKPLIAWTIEEAQKSKYISRLIVSTDDESIAVVAREYGAEVPFLRPPELAQDLSIDVEFLEHALSFLHENEQYTPDVILRLPPTSPLRSADDIDRGIETLLQHPEADAVRPIMEAPKHPYKVWKIGAHGTYLEPLFSKDCTGFDEPHNLPRQLFPKAYIHTGAMDVMRHETITKLHSTSGNKLAFFFMKPEASVNIDSPLDFEFAEFLMERRIKKENEH
jgi:CMP-N,N'-diacetyllegionaminic acid synthase